MLAYADADAPDFPLTGSVALYQGAVVTIHQRTDDGRALVFGPGITSRVALDDLSPATRCGAFDRWRAERLATDAPARALTAQTDLYVDFACWLDANGLDPDPGAPGLFARQLRDAGYLSCRILIPGFIRNRPVTAPAWNVALIGDDA